MDAPNPDAWREAAINEALDYAERLEISKILAERKESLESREGELTFAELLISLDIDPEEFAREHDLTLEDIS